MNCVLHGYRIPIISTVTQPYKPSNQNSNIDKTLMQLAINNLLDLGAISVCKYEEPQYISPIFLTPKPNGTYRFILNLKSFNKFVQKDHFKMEDYRTACSLLPENGYAATIDLKEAYLLVPIHIDDKKYLRFQFETKTYQFNSMCYGLSTAPRTFTKIMKEVFSYLRSRGFSSVSYLDDTLCLGKNYEECLHNVRETVKLLESLGFVINYQKSVLEPKQNCTFLGFIFDTVEMSISLPENKRNRILQLTQKYIKLPRCTIREFSQFIGVLTSACPAVKYGWLYTKIFEREKFLALKDHADYDAKIKLTTALLPDLHWWKSNILVAKKTIIPVTYDLEIFTDASRSGWGAACDSMRANGHWKENELQFHINYLELQAAFLGLKYFARNKFDCDILMRIDNTTAISYINRMGGIQFPHLNDLARSIWQWCEQRGLWLFASYINTKDNKEADEESRKINPDTEIELCSDAFQTIVEQFGQPDIDLFASRSNAKCDTYVSWMPDPDSSNVDAFTISWNHLYFYCFPPLSMILKCLNKIVNEKSTGIIVFPHWPSQPWFPLLKQLLVSEVIYFNDALRSPSRIHLPQEIILAAAIVSGKRLRGGPFLKSR